MAVRILQKGTLTPIGWIRPEALSVDLEERTGRATMTVGPDEPMLTVGDWLMDDTEPAAGIVWRVSGSELQWETRTWRYTLEHIVSTLQDQIIFGELDLSGYAGNAAAQILARSGGTWALGGCEYGVNLPYEFDGETLYDALETISDTLPDCVWEFDLSSIPFKLFFRNKPADKICEMRAGRNLRTLRQSVDRSQLFTRFYPIGKEELTLPGGYISRNEDVYGVITRTETNQSIDNEAMLRAWAEDKLRRHSVPTVTISVTGLELADATGEDLDRIRPGRMCQVPLPETGGNIYERVVRVSWRDKIRDPEGITATLANKVTDVATIIRKEVTGSSSTAKKGGRAGSKKAKEDHAWFTDTEDHVAMTAEAIIGKDPSGKVNWSRVANLSVSGNGISATVTETQNGLVKAQARVEQTEKSIGQFVEAVGKDGKITAASIVASINGSGSEVAISADHIRLSGNTTINDIFTVQDGLIIAKAPIKIGFGDYSQIRQDRIRTIRLELYSGAGQYAALDSSDILNMITKAEVKGNKLYLYPKSAPNAPITFSRATALRGQWSGGIYTVTAQGDSSVPQNKAQIKQLTPGGNVGKIGKYVGQDIYVYATENGGSNGVSTGFHQEVWIDASDVWQDGYDAGAGSGPSYPNSLTLQYDRVETSTAGGVQTWTYYYKYTRNSAYRPMGNSCTVHW